MKRVFALLLALAMLLTLLPAALAEGRALPAVGDVVQGFEVKETREFPLIGAEIVLFEHQKTGAQLMYIANDDVNRVFQLTFFTEATDNTGLPHVFEHATLGGSDKYPSKDLFFDMIYQTYNTYINAYTDQWDTCYPVASLSEAQLLKLADVYTDGCLHPMLMTDESIYREEAWRYRMDTPDSDLTIEGTVYSEMQGSTSNIVNVALNNAMIAAFPGSMAGNNSGGDPAYIPDMTWDMLREYHDKYYHPSNCLAFLYGEFEDYEAFLALLDEAFSPYEKRECPHRVDADYVPITEPVVQEFAFPATADAAVDNGCVLVYEIVCPGADEEQQLILNTLTDLMIEDSSVLQQSLQKALPYGDFGTYIELSGPEPAIVFYALYVNREDAEVFKATVDEALAEIAQEGFSQEHVDGVMANLNISSKLVRESSSVGVDEIVEGFASYAASSAGVWGYLDYENSLEKMDEWNQQGLYAKAVSDWLVGSQTTALSVTYPEPGMKEAIDAAEAERLAQVKVSMTEEEINAIVEASNAPKDEGKDDAEMIAQLQVVTIETLPEEVKIYDITDETDENGIRHVDALAAVDGIGQTGIFLDAAGVPQEDLHWLKLFVDLTSELETNAHDKTELSKLVTRYLYSKRINISLLGKGNDFHAYLRMGWIGIDEELSIGYDLMREIVFDLKLDDAEKLLKAVQGFKANLKSSISNEPYNMQIYRALGRTSSLDRLYVYLNFTDYYTFLNDVEALLTSDPDAAIAKLQAIQASFNNSTNAVTLYAGSEEGIAVNRPLADAFLASLDSAPIQPQSYDLPEPADIEGFIIDSTVQFNSLVADYEALGLDGYNAALDVVTNALLSEYLIKHLREEYGVYSVFHGAMSDEGVYLVTYRDPNVLETFNEYAQLPEFVSALELDQDTLNGYILAAYSGYATPAGELSGALSAALATLEGRPQDEALEWMRQLKEITPEVFQQYADIYQNLLDNGLASTSGSAAQINANSNIYDVIYNPFGSLDKTKIEFVDLPEDHPNYEAVRFAYEEGLMAPAAEDTFGVDEPATNGDTLAAMNVLIQGPLDPNDALETFVYYGLADPDMDLDAPVEAEYVYYLLSALIDEPYQPEGEIPETMTRSELAQALYDFNMSLE